MSPTRPKWFCHNLKWKLSTRAWHSGKCAVFLGRAKNRQKQWQPATSTPTAKPTKPLDMSTEMEMPTGNRVSVARRRRGWVSVSNFLALLASGVTWKGHVTPYAHIKCSHNLSNRINLNRVWASLGLALVLLLRCCWLWHGLIKKSKS